MTVETLELPDTWTLHGDHYDVGEEWTEADDDMLSSLLGLTDHLLDHDPVACQIKLTPPGWTGQPIPRAEWTGIRQCEDMTVADVAELCGVDPATVSRWETGKREPDNRVYLAWLREADSRQTPVIVFDVWKQIARRDGWTRDLGRERMRRHWRAVFGPGGSLDVWRDTGELPAWTPDDAGVR